MSKGTKNEPGDWIDDKFEDAFEDFEAKIEACYADEDKLSQKTVINFLDFLMSQKDYILQLPTSTKVSEFTVQRFFLFLLPLIGMLHELSPKKAEAQLRAFIGLLLDSDFILSVKFNA